MSAHSKLNILFLCTGNSCRSQMAEGWARALKPDVLQPYSAGIETHGLNPYAVRAMQEAGVDISGQQSTHVSEFSDIDFDYVITVCSHADAYCPVFRGDALVIHNKGFDDPPKLAANEASDEGKMRHYRRVRDEIRAYIETLPQSLPPR